MARTGLQLDLGDPCAQRVDVPCALRRVAPHGDRAGRLELVSNGVAILNNGPDNDRDETEGGDISGAPYEAMKDIRLAAAFLSHGGGATPVNSNGASWNVEVPSR